MITKDRLIAGLNELINVEEGMVTLFANFSKALVKQTSEIKKAKKDDILKMLSYLYRDSARHKEIVDGIIEEVTKGAANEY